MLWGWCRLKKNTSGKMRLTFIKEESHKVFTGLLARRLCKSPETFCIQKDMQKESLVSIRVRTAAPAWLCIFHYIKLTVYKHLLKIKLWGFCTSLAPPMLILSLSLFPPLPPSPFQAEFPSGIQRLATPTNIAWASKTHTGRCFASPFLQETGRAPVA